MLDGWLEGGAASIDAKSKKFEQRPMHRINLTGFVFFKKANNKKTLWSLDKTQTSQMNVINTHKRIEAASQTDTQPKKSLRQTHDEDHDESSIIPESLHGS